MLLYSKERWGVNGYGSISEEFTTLVESLGLQVLPLVGSKYIPFLEGWAMLAVGWTNFW